MNSAPQAETRLRNTTPQLTNLQQEPCPLTELHQNQHLHNQPGRPGRQSHATRLLSLAKLRQQLQASSRRHEMRESPLLAKLRYKHQHRNTPPQQNQFNKPPALKQLRRAQQHLFNEGIQIQQHRLGRFARISQIMLRLRQGRGLNSPSTQSQKVIEHTRLGERQRQSKLLQLHKLRQELFERSMENRKLTLEKHLTKQKQKLLAMKQQHLQNKVDLLEKQLKDHDKNLTQKLSDKQKSQNRDDQQQRKNQDKTPDRPIHDTMQQGQNQDEWINRIKDTLENGRSASLPQDQHGTQSPTTVTQSKQKQMKQANQPQDKQEDKRQKWIGRKKIH